MTFYWPTGWWVGTKKKSVCRWHRTGPHTDAIRFCGLWKLFPVYPVFPVYLNFVAPLWLSIIFIVLGNYRVLLQLNYGALTIKHQGWFVQKSFWKNIHFLRVVVWNGADRMMIHFFKAFIPTSSLYSIHTFLQNNPGGKYLVWQENFAPQIAATNFVFPSDPLSHAWWSSLQGCCISWVLGSWKNEMK